jgi:ABC-2 type transport system permease protein
MRNIWIIAWREFKQFFGSPIAYALGLLIFGFLGPVFVLQLNQISQSGAAQALPGQMMLGPLMTLSLFTLPAVTMRLISEENRQGTLEILLTAPIRDVELVLGKFLGALMFSTGILAATFIFPLFLNAMTKPNGIDQGPLVSAYLIFFLLMASLLAIGLVFSAVFANSIAAFFTSLAVSLTLWIFGMVAQYFYSAGSMGTSSPLEKIAQYMDFTSHFYNSAYYGKLDLQDAIYYISIIVLGLFLAVQIVQSKRWR